MRKKIPELNIEKPRLEDLHVASLYLQACEIFWLGTNQPMPNCWDLFDGKLFFYLCQNSAEIGDLKIYISKLMTKKLQEKWMKIIKMNKTN